MTAAPGWLAPEGDRVGREAAIDRFEDAWQDEEPPRIADFLPPDGPDRTPLLLELVKIDLERRWDRGDRRRVEDYAADHPELADPLARMGELLAAEIAVRRRHGCPPTAAELLGRFGDRTTILDRDAPLEHATQPPARLGRYELRAPVGRGSFATVYRAWDPELRREVAVKVPRPEPVADPAGRERVLREARGAARLRHPAVVPLHEAGEDGGRLFLVYDLVPGPTLAERLREGRPDPRAGPAVRHGRRVRGRPAAVPRPPPGPRPPSRARVPVRAVVPPQPRARGHPRGGGGRHRGGGRGRVRPGGRGARPVPCRARAGAGEPVPVPHRRGPGAEAGADERVPRAGVGPAAAGGGTGHAAPRPGRAAAGGGRLPGGFRRPGTGGVGEAAGRGLDRVGRR